MSHDAEHAHAQSPFDYVAFFWYKVFSAVNVELQVWEAGVVAAGAHWKLILDTVDVCLVHDHVNKLSSIGLWHQQETCSTVNNDLLISSKAEFGIVRLSPWITDCHVCQDQCPPFLAFLVDIMIN